MIIGGGTLLKTESVLHSLQCYCPDGDLTLAGPDGRIHAPKEKILLPSTT